MQLSPFTYSEKKLQLNRKLTKNIKKLFIPIKKYMKRYVI